MRNKIARRQAKTSSPFTPPELGARPSTVGMMSDRIKRLEDDLARLKRQPASLKRADKVKGIEAELERLYGWLNDTMDAESYDAPTVEGRPAQEVSAPNGK